MLKLSVCIEMYWPDLPYTERIARVAALGFPAFEFWGWKNKDIPKIGAAMAKHDLPIAALCLEPGFSLIKRHFQADLIKGMQETAVVAQELNCQTIIATTGNTYDDRRRVLRNIRTIAPIAEEHGLTIVLEPLNTLVDHHGYWLTRMSQAADLVQEINSPAVKILMDLYHQQITEGNIIQNLRDYAGEIGHFHTAGVGYVGLEYRPTMDTEASLKQALGLVER